MKNCNRILKQIIFGHLFILLFLNVDAQSIYLDTSYNGMSLEDFADKIELDYGYKVYFLFDSIPAVNINNISDDVSMQKFFKDVNIFCSFDSKKNLILSNKNIVTTFPDDFFKLNEEIQNSSDAVKEEKFLETKSEYFDKTITVGDLKKGNTKGKHTVSGYIKNKEDGEPVVGATIFIKELELGAVTSPYGYYNINLPQGEYTLEISSVGRKSDKKSIKVLSDGQLNIFLEEELVSLDEVVVTAEKYDNVKNNKLGFEKIPIKNIRQIPVILGERDVMKVALMLPGIQNTGEGSSGFNVRGSPADQNLFYINNVPLYNTSHLFGFFSVFNSDAISDFSIYKGHIPVNYGGRLASIFEVTTKNGNDQEFSARGGISPITGKILVEGPIKKDRGSYLAAVRTTYSDWLLNFVKDPDIRNSKAQFQDGLLNLSFDITPIDKVKLFTYQSYDKINLSGTTKFDYLNQGYSLRWGHIIKQKHMLNVDFVHARYKYSEKNQETDILSYSHNYDLTHDEVKFNLEIRPNNIHTVSVGSNAILYNLYKGKHQPLAETSTVKPIDLGNEKGLESSLYVGDSWDITSRLNLSFGARLNYYAYLGEQTIYEYSENTAREINNITDTLNYGNNQIIKSYINPDYRVAIKYLLFQNSSIKVAYNRLHQNIFMLSNTVSISPSDRWKLSDSHITPIQGDQYSIGFYQKLFRGKADFSVETYYKEVENLVEYKDGADLLVNEVVETDILQGDLSSYGLELSIKKPLGRFNGWLNYVYSRSSVTVDSDIQGNQINFGEEYPSNYEKPHAINLVGNYKFSRRFSFSTSLVYSTGRPVTYPSASYTQGGSRVLHYSKRNEFRIPDYFRIDASIGLEGNLLSKKIAHGSWMFSVYNLTGRQNAYSVYFKNENGAIKGYQLSIFGKPIFTITYNFKLGNYAS